MNSHAIYLLQHKQFLHFPVMVNPNQRVTEHSALNCSQLHAGHPGGWHQEAHAAQYTMENPTTKPQTRHHFIKSFIKPFFLLDACTLSVEKLDNNLTEFGQNISTCSKVLPCLPNHSTHVSCWGKEEHNWARNTSLFLLPQFPKKSALTIIILEITQSLQHQFKSPIVERLRKPTIGMP